MKIFTQKEVIVREINVIRIKTNKQEVNEQTKNKRKK